VGGSTLLVDTADPQQARQMAMVAPDHATSQVDVQWNRIRSQTIPLMPLSGPRESVLVLYDLTWLAKAICKSRPAYL